MAFSKSVVGALRQVDCELELALAHCNLRVNEVDRCRRESRNQADLGRERRECPNEPSSRERRERSRQDWVNEIAQVEAQDETERMLPVLRLNRPGDGPSNLRFGVRFLEKFREQKFSKQRVQLRFGAAREEPEAVSLVGDLGAALAELCDKKL